MNLAKKLGKSGPIKVVRKPLWQGPEVDGITQSLLSRWLVCRERFRVMAIEGLRPKDEFHSRLHYGEMWHVCEEVHACGGDWKSALKTFASTLIARYRTQQEQVVKWYNICLLQFPIYIAQWKKTKVIPVFQEKVFKTPYELPNGRVVILRGKLDSVFKKDDRVWLQENKTKGEINEPQLQRQLKFDLQTMLYLVALQELLPRDRIGGVVYNVVRRPLSGGKFSIKPMKGKKYKTKPDKLDETPEQFLFRLGKIIENNKDFFFMRWTVHITQRDIEKFRTEFLDPCLMEMCHWYYAVTHGVIGKCINGHYRTPYGLYNPMLEGVQSDLDEYLDTGSEVGLVRVKALFGELG